MEITFYVLPAEAPLSARLTTACRLTEKAWQQGRQVLLTVDARAQAEALDELLWTYKPTAFVPHHLVGEGPTPPPPVRITDGEPPPECRDVRIHLGAQPASELQRFSRLIEIVAGTDQEREQARAHWKHYRQLGFQVQAHELPL